MPKLTIANTKAKQIYDAHPKFKRWVHPTVGRTTKIENSELKMKDEQVKKWNPHKSVYEYASNHDAVSYNDELRSKMNLKYCNRCDVYKNEKCFVYKCNQCKTCTKETRIDRKDVKRLYKSLKRDFKDACRCVATSLEFSCQELSFKGYLQKCVYRRFNDIKEELQPLLKFMEDAEKRGYYCTIDENHIDYDSLFLFVHKNKPKNGMWWWNNGMVCHPKNGTLEDWYEFKIYLKELIMLSGLRQSAKKTKNIFNIKL